MSDDIKAKLIITKTHIQTTIIGHYPSQIFIYIYPIKIYTTLFFMYKYTKTLSTRIKNNKHIILKDIA